jgi:hypothetical protein
MYIFKFNVLDRHYANYTELNSSDHMHTKLLPARMQVVPRGQEFPAHGSDKPEINNTITFYFYFEKILIFCY